MLTKPSETLDLHNTNSINNWQSVSAELSPPELRDPLQQISRSQPRSSVISPLDVAAFDESGTQSSSSGIQGTKWNDLNGNGVKDAGEPGLAGWTIYIDQNNNAKLDSGEKSTTTDANGNYSFTNLEPGTYTVAEVQRPGWQQTSPGSVSNGSFETGNFTGWNTLGSTNVQTTVSGINPTQGTYQAVISNGGSSVTDSALESFLGLSTGALDGMGNGNATQGSAIKLSPITVAAGTTVTFDWDFLTGEATPSSFYNDFAFVSIKDLTELADTNSTFVTPPGSVKQTGYKTFSYTFTTAGTYAIGLGVVDVGDSTVDSTLLVDNVSLNSTQAVNLASEQTVNNINFGNKAISLLAESNDIFSQAFNSGLSSTSPGTFSSAGVMGDNPNVAPGLDVDFIKFQLNAGDKVTIDIDTAGLNSSLDSFLRLFDADGNVLAVNDDAPAPGEAPSLDFHDSYLNFTAKVSGTYYIAVSGYNNFSYNPLSEGSGTPGATGAYNFTLNVIPLGPFEPNDAIPQATNTGIVGSGSASFSASIGDGLFGTTSGDYDWFSLSANAGQMITIDIDAQSIGSSLDTAVGLYNSSGTLLAVNYDYGSSLDSFLEFTTNTADTYYVVVRGYGAGFQSNPFNPSSGLGVGSTGAYNLKLSVNPASNSGGFNSDYGYGLVDAAAAVANALGQTSPFPNVPDVGSNSWGLDTIKAPEVWAKGYTGQGVVVAVVDTGVDYNHVDLDANIWTNSKEIAGNNKDDDGNGFVDDVRGWDFVDNDNNPMDLNGHGTHLAGTIAAENNGVGVTGVAYNAKIMPVRVLDANGSGTFSGVADGIRYAADNGAQVINLSLGAQYPAYDSQVAAAVEYATGKNSVVVMAAGNEYDNRSGFPAYLANQWGISVGAVDNTNTMAYFSNRAGTTPLDYVIAPGVNILSTTPGNTYQSLSGTSMATPHVAGVAALILSAKPDLTPAQVENFITATANPTGIAG